MENEALAQISLREDEINHILSEIEEGEIRCKACNNLNALHSTHCCTFCLVKGCICEWGKMGGFSAE